MAGFTEEELIEKLRVVHGDKYGYDRLGYKRMTKSITITCPIHGDVQVQARNHYNGSGCKECRAYTKNLDACLQKCREKFGDRFDYSLVEQDFLEFNKGKVRIICPNHGEFSVVLRNHWVTNYGCAECSREKQKEVTEQEVRKQIIEQFPEYNLSLFEYKGMLEKAVVICPTHGPLEVFVVNVVRGHGCRRCNGGKSKIEEFWFDTFSSRIPGEWEHSYGREEWPIGPVDMFLVTPDAKEVAIEYDGSYWHSDPDVLRRDSEKTNFLLGDGVYVIRIRTGELPPISGAKNVFAPDRSIHTVTDQDIEIMVQQIEREIADAA